jgi:hypothetical protein
MPTKITIQTVIKVIKNFKLILTELDGGLEGGVVIGSLSLLFLILIFSFGNFDGLFSSRFKRSQISSF